MSGYPCPYCNGEVDMTLHAPVCKDCGAAWFTHEAYWTDKGGLKKTKSSGYLVEELPNDLEKLILIAQRQFAEELIDSLDSTISEYKEWLDSRDSSWGAEWTRVDGGYRALKELCDGFKRAMGDD